MTHAALTEVTERRKHDDNARMMRNFDPEVRKKILGNFFENREILFEILRKIDEFLL